MKENYKIPFLIDGGNEYLEVYPTVIAKLNLKNWDIITKDKVKTILELQDEIDFIESLL